MVVASGTKEINRDTTVTCDTHAFYSFLFASAADFGYVPRGAWRGVTRTSLYATTATPTGQSDFGHAQGTVCERTAASASGGGALRLSSLGLILVTLSATARPRAAPLPLAFEYARPHRHVCAALLAAARQDTCCTSTQL